MSELDAMQHWSSKAGRERRIQKILKDEHNPFRMTFAYGDNENLYLSAIQNWLMATIENRDWSNQSMLLRQIIKMAYVRMLELIDHDNTT